MGNRNSSNCNRPTLYPPSMSSFRYEKGLGDILMWIHTDRETFKVYNNKLDSVTNAIDRIRAIPGTTPIIEDALGILLVQREFLVQSENGTW